MQLLKRSSAKVGLFFVTLSLLFAGSIIHSPVASAAGEYYQYFPKPPGDNSIRMSGGILNQAAGLRNVRPQVYEGNISIPGIVARNSSADPQQDPRDPRYQQPCLYSIQVIVDGNTVTAPNDTGVVAVRIAGMPFTLLDGLNPLNIDFRYGAPGSIGGESKCMLGDGSEGFDIMNLIGDEKISLTTDPPVSESGTQCPVANSTFEAAINKCVVPANPDGTCSEGSAPLPGRANTCSYEPSSLEDPAEPDVCPIEKNTSLRWMACPIVAGGETLTGILDSTINYFLTIDTAKVFGSATGQNTTPDPNSNRQSTGFYTAWTTFRNFGIGLVVIAGLIMVISEALGLQFVDAYTLRKTLPRLFIAVIGIALSWSLMYFLITFFNRLGTGMASLIYSSFGSIGAGAKDNVGAVIFAQYFGLGGGLVALGVIGMLSFLGTFIISLLVGIAVLVVREGIILMCVIISPLAIAAYILPNTAKFASFWWDTFIKALMAFPIITGFIAICKVMAIVSKNI